MSRIAKFFTELNRQNRDAGYKLALEKKAPAVFAVLSAIGIGMIMFYGLLDPFYDFDNQAAITGLRFASVFMMAANYVLYLYVFKRSVSARNFILSGFYISAFSTTLLAIYTGEFYSPYWPGVILSLFIWFFAAPFKFQTRILHGIIYLLVYFGSISYSAQSIEFGQQFAELLFYIGASFAGGCLAAILSNNNDASIYFKEKALKESEAKYRNLILQATDGIIITQNGCFEFVNQAFCNMVGYTEDELIGRPFLELVKEEDRERLHSYHKKRMAGDAFRLIYTAKGIRKDLSTIEMELNSTTILFNGKPAAFITLRDLTERIKTQEALRKANERLMLHIHHTPLGYIEWDEDLRVVEWNPASEKIFGFTREQTLGKSAFELIVPDENAQEVNRIWKQLLSQDEGSYTVSENITADGRPVFCEWFNTPLKNHEGKAVGLASLIQDETERRNLERELELSHAVLKQDYSLTLEQVKSFTQELKEKENQLLKLQKDHLQSQFDTLKNQVNPHFLFNSLNVLNSLISVNPELAETFTGQLSKIYRYILEHRSEDLVSLKTELEFLNAYLFLLQIRFADKLSVNLNIPEEYTEKKLPPLALQILMENVIKHNTFSLKAPLKVQIFVDEHQNLNIVNNLQKREAAIKSTGLGLQNITDRYAYFTKRKTWFGEQQGSFVARIPLI